MKMDDASSLDRRAGSNGPASDAINDHGQSTHLLEVIDASNARNCNPSGNRPFEDVLKARASRRALLAGGLGLAASTFFTSTEPALARGGRHGWHKPHKPLIGFTPVAVADGNGPIPSISPDYEYQVLIPWGDPLEPGGPSYDADPTTRPTAPEQLRQIGIGHDGMWFFPKEYRHRWHGSFHRYMKHYKSHCTHGMLAINHEFGGNEHVLGKAAPQTLDDVRLSQHAHGVSVVEIKKIWGKWRQVRSRNARRIHVNTPVRSVGRRPATRCSKTAPAIPRRAPSRTAPTAIPREART